MTDGEWWRNVLFICLFPSDSLSPSSNAGDTASRGPPNKSLWVCEHSCRGDEQQRMHMCAGVYTYSFLSSPSFFFGFLSPPRLRLLQPVMITSLLTDSALFSFSLWMGKEDKDRVRWQSMAVGDGWLPLCTQVNCLWGHGLTQSSHCGYMRPFTAIWTFWTLLPSNITVLLSSQQTPTTFVLYLLKSSVS